jgi:CubicO group peptidase (beta-lactamase class C family)
MDYCEKINEHAGKALVNYDLSGLAIGAWAGERCPLDCRGLDIEAVAGFADFAERLPLGEGAIFHMASVSKLFTATAFLMLAERGLADLEAPVTSLLPWLRMRDERLGAVNAFGLLSHTAGMPDVTDYGWDEPQIDGGALKRYLLSEDVAGRGLLWGPGEGRFQYSNIGYEMLGAAVAELSGMDFESFIEENIFKALDMRDSDFLTWRRTEAGRRAAEAGSSGGMGAGGSGGVGAAVAGSSGGAGAGGMGAAGAGSPDYGRAERDRIAEYLSIEGLKKAGVCAPHMKDEEKRIVRYSRFPYNRAHAPSSTLTSNLRDLKKWGEALLRGGLLKPETRKAAAAPRALVPNNGEHMGLGCFIRIQNGYTLYGHEGTDDGFRASFWVCPELDLQTAVMSNMEKAPVKAINRQVFDILTGD